MDDENRKPQVIETASATTSKDNENSGPFAYILTAVCLGVLLVVSVLGVGCTSLVFASIAPSEDVRGSSSAFPDYFDEDFDSELDDWLDQYYGIPNDSTNDDSTHSKESGFADVADVLDFSIAPYNTAIENEVGASSYAGTPAEVRDYVRSIVETDEDYTSQLVVLLDNAAKKEDDRAANIREAKQLCVGAKEAMEKIEVPTLQKDEDGDVAYMLDSGKAEAAKRWKYLADEMSLLDTTRTVSTKRLWDIDDKVADATMEAGEDLENAMYAASRL